MSESASRFKWTELVSSNGVGGTKIMSCRIHSEFGHGRLEFYDRAFQSANALIEPVYWFEIFTTANNVPRRIKIGPTSEYSLEEAKRICEAILVTGVDFRRKQ